MTKHKLASYETRSIVTWLNKINNNEVALPAYQRSYTWGKKHSRKQEDFLFALLENRPTGMLLVLPCRSGETGINCRNFEVIDDKKWCSDNVDEQILDGQQRLTALLEIMKGAVQIKTNRQYYVKVEDLVNLNMEVKQVVSYADNTLNGRRLQQQNVAYDTSMVPANLLCPENFLLDNEKSRIREWCKSAIRDSDSTTAPVRRSNDRVKNLSRAINKLRSNLIYPRKLHHCQLPEEMRTVDAIRVFVETNKNSTPVTSFEIVVAESGGKNYKVNFINEIENFCKIKGRKNTVHYVDQKEKNKKIPQIGDFLLKAACLKIDKGVAPTHTKFLEAFSNLFIKKNHKTRTERLDSKTGLGNLRSLMTDLESAFKFIAQCGVLSKSGFSNAPAFHVLVALQSAMNAIKDPALAGSANKLLETYFWRSFCTNRYRANANQLLLEDFRGLASGLKKIADGKRVKLSELADECPVFEKRYKIPTTKDLASLTTPWSWMHQPTKHPSFMYTGFWIAAIVLRSNPCDWASGVKLDSETLRELENAEEVPNAKRLERHHIFPRKFLEKNGVKADNQINHGLNCAFLISSSNQKFSDEDPADYISKIRQVAPNTPQKEIRNRIKSHIIPYENCLTKSNSGSVKERYKLFIQKRAEMVAAEIAKLTAWETE